VAAGGFMKKFKKKIFLTDSPPSLAYVAAGGFDEFLKKIIF